MCCVSHVQKRVWVWGGSAGANGGNGMHMDTECDSGLVHMHNSTIITFAWP